MKGTKQGPVIIPEPTIEKPKLGIPPFTGIISDKDYIAAVKRYNAHIKSIPHYGFFDYVEDGDKVEYEFISNPTSGGYAVPMERKSEDQLEDEVILNNAKIDALVINWFEKWCEKTKIGGGVLITTSIKEVLVSFYKDQIFNKSSPAQKEMDADFTLWIWVNKWEYDYETHEWINNYIKEFEEGSWKHFELYQLFLQHKNK